MPDADFSDNGVVDAVGGSGVAGHPAAYTPEEVQALRITRVNVQEDVLYCVLSDGKLLSVAVGGSAAPAAGPAARRRRGGSWPVARWLSRAASWSGLRSAFRPRSRPRRRAPVISGASVETAKPSSG